MSELTELDEFLDRLNVRIRRYLTLTLKDGEQLDVDIRLSRMKPTDSIAGINQFDMRYSGGMGIRLTKESL